MANWYVSSVDYAAVAQFALTHAYSVGNIVRQLTAPAVGNERCFRCTTAGSSAGSEAGWTLTKGSTTTQGGAVFTEVTGVETYQAAGAWGAPFARLQTITTWIAVGDTVYIAANHAETQASAMSVTGGGTGPGATITNVICVDNSGTGHVPPQAGDTRTTATVSTTGAFGIAVGMGGAYWYGITFSAGSGSSGASITFGTPASFAYWNKFEACKFILNNTNATSTLITGGATTNYVEWVNCQVTFGVASQNVLTTRSTLVWRNTAAAAVLGVATNFVVGDNGISSMLVMLDGLDFSNLAHGRIINQTAAGTVAVMTNCKVNSATALGNGPASLGTSRVDAIGCDSGGNVYRNERATLQAQLTTDAVVVRTGGASDGTTPIAWQVASGSQCAWNYAFEAFPIAQWNGVTGSAKTVSFEAIANAAAVLNNDQLWMDVAYLGTAASTQATIGTSTKANILAAATAVAASTQAWDSAATARANSFTYALGDVIKVSSNTGRVFFCTTIGTSAGSLPGGYATAVDGGSVTDGVAVFRAGVRMKVSLAVTPQVAGLIRVTPKVGVASTTLYIDPLLSIV